MPSITRRPSNADDRRQAVETQVFAAVNRLLDRGEKYTELSVQRIIEEAGIARSTFYLNFRDKSDLLSRTVRALKLTVCDAGKTRMQSEQDPDDLAQGLLETITSYRAHWALFSAVKETAVFDPTVGDYLGIGVAFEEGVTEHLRARQEAGLTDPDLDPEATSRLIVWGGAQAIAHHIEYADPAADASFAREMALTWWFGAYARPHQEQIARPANPS